MDTPSRSFPQERQLPDALLPAWRAAIMRYLPGGYDGVLSTLNAWEQTRTRCGARAAPHCLDGMPRREHRIMTADDSVEA